MKDILDLYQGIFDVCARQESELAALREQVKVLREALGWLVNEMDCRDDEFGGCLFTQQDFKIARDALAQTKPKEGEWWIMTVAPTAALISKGEPLCQFVLNTTMRGYDMMGRYHHLSVINVLMKQRMPK